MSYKDDSETHTKSLSHEKCLTMDPPVESQFREVVPFSRNRFIFGNLCEFRGIVQFKKKILG